MALANRKKQVVVFSGCSCHSVVLASDYVQAAAVKTVHTAHQWLSERPGFRCVSQREMLLDEAFSQQRLLDLLVTFAL